MRDNTISLGQILVGSFPDYCGVETLTYPYNINQKGWTGFVVHTPCKVTAITYRNKTNVEVTISPTWLNQNLVAGLWIPAGVLNGHEYWITSITLSQGSVILYT